MPIFVPFACDVRDYLNKHSGPEETWSALENFECKAFQWLPASELEQILKTNLLYFVANLPNSVMEFKRVYWLEELSDDGTWSQPLRAAVENNVQQIGTSGLTRDGKNYPPTVANWIKDYIAYLDKPLTERVAFDQVQYIERAPNVQRLSANERKYLLEIIKLHSWLMRPEVTEAEIDAYELELAKKQPKAAQAPNLPVAPKPTGDWIKSAAESRAEDQQKIDSKLSELKSKVKDKI